MNAISLCYTSDHQTLWLGKITSHYCSYTVVHIYLWRHISSITHFSLVFLSRLQNLVHYYSKLKIRLTKLPFIFVFVPKVFNYTMNYFTLTGLKTKVSAWRPAEWEAFSTTLLDFELPQYIAIYVLIRQGSLFCFIHFVIGQNIHCFVFSPKLHLIPFFYIEVMFFFV